MLRTGTAPALAVALTDRERTLAVRTYGQASPEMLWPIGSIGKSIAAVIALQLVDEGVLALDRPITRDLPWFALRSELGPITLHHLLTHTAGVIATSDLAPASGYDVIALAETEPGFAPGEHRLYSDLGYRTIGVLLERVTGRAFPDLVQERVFDPFGMRDSAPAIVHDTRRRLPGGHVPFYDDRPWRPEHGLVPAPWIESAEADGCECCTPEDLARFLRALWRGDPLIRTPQPPVGDADYEYGYGLVIEPDGFGHGGDMPGYVSHMWADESSGHGVVAFANGIAGAFALGEAALALVRGDEPDPWSPELADPLVDDGSALRPGSPISVATARTTRGDRRFSSPRARASSSSAPTGWTASGCRSRRSVMRCSASVNRRGRRSGCASTRTATGGPTGRRSPACRTTGRSAPS